MLKQDAASSDLNIDAGTLYIDVSNNRVGIANTSPSQALDVTGNVVISGTATATTFVGSGASLTSIPNSALTNSSITINSTATSLGGSITLGTDDVAEGSTNLYYTDARADARVALVVDSAPSTLNTLNELAAALGDDANFSTTVTNSIAAKLPLAGGTMTGDIFINGGSTTERNLRIQNTDNVLYVGVEGSSGNRFVDSSANNAFLGTTSNSGLEFGTANTVRAVIDSSGNVGIGTTSPTGKITIANPTAYAPNTVTAANSYIQLGSTDYGSGGSSSNDGKFMIGFGYTEGTTNTHSPAYIGYEETSTLGDTKGELTFYTRDVITDTAPTQRMSIASDGKIDMYPSGAETTGGLRVVYDGDNNYEVARFQAEGDQDAHISFVSNGATGYYWGIGIDYSDNGAFKISNDNLLTTNNELRIDRNGDVSLAANATGAALIKGVSGNQVNRNAGGYPQYTFVGNEGTGMRRASSNVLAFDSGGEERMRIDTSGNVGIGTTSPQTALSFGESASATGITFLSTNTGFNSGKTAGIRGEISGAGYGGLAFDTFAGGSGGGERMRITATGAVQILHGNTTYYTSFEDQNEINTYATNGTNATMYIQHSGGDLDVGAGVFTLDRTNKRIKIRNSIYASANTPLFISNGTEGPAVVYDTVVISQNDVPCIRLDETASGQELTLAVGDENGNNAVIGTTGSLSLATNRGGGITGYSNGNTMVKINTAQVLVSTGIEIKTTDDQILTLNQNDTGGWNYIGFESQSSRKWYLGMDSSSNFVLGSDVAGKTVEIGVNLRAPGIIIQTVRADVEGVAGTGDFDIVSVNITPKFANSDMLIHFYTQWSVYTNDGEDWGMRLQRDGANILGDSQNSYFISGGGVDASDNVLAQTSYSNPRYHVRTASKTDIDTGRSNGTSTITYKIRKYVPAGTSTKTVRFGQDGWQGNGVESQRSKTVLLVQEIMPN